MIEVYRPNGCSGNCLVTIAIGDVYKSEWKTHALPGWLKYCDRHDLGLFVVTADLIAKEEERAAQIDPDNLFAQIQGM